MKGLRRYEAMRRIDTKYQTSGDITRLDGTPIPEDEPLILFRGRDRLVLPMLEHYLQLRLKAGTSKDRLRLLQQQMGVIKEWQQKNIDRTQIPD
jgi:hypothetical protein